MVKGKVWFIFILMMAVLAAIGYCTLHWDEWKKTYIDETYRKVAWADAGHILQTTVRATLPKNPLPPFAYTASCSFFFKKGA